MRYKWLWFCLLFLCVSFEETVAQEANAEVIKYTTTCVVEKDKLTQTDFVTIQVNNRAGDEYAEIEIPYSKNERVSDIAAWIETPDGTRVRELKKSEMVDKSAISDISLFEDNYKKCFQLKHNSYPYIVTYTYKTTIKNFIELADWKPVLHHDIPTRSAKLKVILPKGYAFNKFVHRIPDCRIDSSGVSVVLECNASYDRQIQKELFSQPADEYPSIIVAPLNFQYGVEGSTKDWASFGNWQYRLIQGLDVLPDEEKATVTALINGITDKREIVKTLYHYLQDHTRYINVTIGIGGYKPYPASYVAQNKYGDCKALTNYMKALLSYVGIASCYTLVYADEQPRNLVREYSGSQFNHAVLAVPLGKDTIWLDNTSKTNPFGYMGVFTQNREALLIDKDQSRLVRIPAMTKEECRVAYKIQFDCNASGNANTWVNISFRGEDFEQFNGLHASYTEDEKDRWVRDYMPFNNYEVVNWELLKHDRDSTNIDLQAKLNLYKFLKPLGNELYFSLYPVRMPFFTVPAARKLPMAMPYPFFHSDSLIYSFPKGYEVKTIQDAVSLTSRFGTYTLSMKIVDGKLLVVKQMVLFAGNYSLEQYAQFYAFIQSVKEKDRQNIIITPIDK